jgi:hypothetical protein
MEKNTIKIKQLCRQTEAWKKILGFLEQENTAQKNKLAEMLKIKEERDGDDLEADEHFQNLFLQQDQAYRLMWFDITNLEKLVEEDISGNYSHTRQIDRWQKKLNKEVGVLEKAFEKLKTDFAKYLATLND